VRWAADHGDGWFLLPVPPAGARAQITAALAALPRREVVVEQLCDPGGVFGVLAGVLRRRGEAGADRVVLGGAAGGRHRLAGNGAVIDR